MSLLSNIQTLLKNSFSDHVYLRASTLEQADRDLIREHIANKPVIIFSNLPEITVSQGVSTLEEVYPIVIHFGMQCDLDASGDELDDILEACKEQADKFWDLLLHDENFIEGIILGPQGDDVYTLTPFMSFEMGGENLAGYVFQAEIRQNRATQTTS